MEYAEKMYLVPSAQLQELRGVPENIRSATVRRLDSEMREILLRSDLPEYEKAKLYNGVLQRFLALTRQEDMEKTVPQPPQASASLPSPPAPQESLPSVIQEVLDSLPNRYKKNAEILLSKLRQHQEISSWDDKGSFQYRGELLPGSNILDLVRGITQSTALSDKRKPKGWDVFLKALAELNIPTSIVGNSTAREQLEAMKSAATPSSSPSATAVVVRPKKQFKRPEWLYIKELPTTPVRPVVKKPEWLTL